MVDEHLAEHMVEAGDHNRVASEFVLLRLGNACLLYLVDVGVGHVHKTETLARREFADAEVLDEKVVVGIGGRSYGRC